MNERSKRWEIMLFPSRRRAHGYGGIKAVIFVMNMAESLHASVYLLAAVAAPYNVDRADHAETIPCDTELLPCDQLTM